MYPLLVHRLDDRCWEQEDTGVTPVEPVLRRKTHEAPSGQIFTLEKGSSDGGSRKSPR